MIDKMHLAVPLALLAAGAVGDARAAAEPAAEPAAAPAAAPKVLRVLARHEGPLERGAAGEGESLVKVTSQGLHNVIRIIGGAG
jgi:hypothetical protein